MNGWAGLARKHALTVSSLVVAAVLLLAIVGRVSAAPTPPTGFTDPIAGIAEPSTTPPPTSSASPSPTSTPTPAPPTYKPVQPKPRDIDDDDDDSDDDDDDDSDVEDDSDDREDAN